MARARPATREETRPSETAESGADSGPRWRGLKLQFLDLPVYALGGFIGGVVFLRWPTGVGVLPFVAAGAAVVAAGLWSEADR